MQIFKYFTKEAHALAFMRQGQIRFGSLKYYRSIEDGGTRGDPLDGTLHYAPEKGFEITVIDDGRTITGSRLTAPAEAMFVFCASLECSENRAIDFGPYCVEINDSETILRRLRTRASAASKIDYERAHMGPTVYRPLDQIPGVDWAFPDRVVLIKPPEYAHQNEFRIVLPLKATRKPSGDYISLIIGNLAGVTKLHTFN